MIASYYLLVVLYAFSAEFLHAGSSIGNLDSGLTSKQSLCKETHSQAFPAITLDQKNQLRKKILRHMIDKSVQLEKYVIGFTSFSSGLSIPEGSFFQRATCKSAEKYLPEYWQDTIGKLQQSTKSRAGVNSIERQILLGFGDSNFSYVTILLERIFESKFLDYIQNKPGNLFGPSFKVSFLKKKQSLPPIFPLTPSSDIYSFPFHRTLAVENHFPILFQSGSNQINQIFSTVKNLTWKKIKEKIDGDLENNFFKAFIQELRSEAHSNFLNQNDKETSKYFDRLYPNLGQFFEKRSISEIDGFETIRSNMQKKYFPFIRAYTKQIVEMHPSIIDDFIKTIAVASSKWHLRIASGNNAICNANLDSMENDPFAFTSYYQNLSVKEQQTVKPIYCSSNWGRTRLSITQSSIHALSFAALVATIFTPFPDEWLFIKAIMLHFGAIGLTTDSIIESTKSFQKLPLIGSVYGAHPFERIKLQVIAGAQLLAIPGTFLLSHYFLSQSGGLIKRSIVTQLPTPGDPNKILSTKNLDYLLNTPLKYLSRKPTSLNIAVQTGGQNMLIPNFASLSINQLWKWFIPLGISTANNAQAYRLENKNPLTEYPFWTDTLLTHLFFGASTSLFYSSHSTNLIANLSNLFLSTIKSVALFQASDLMVQNTRHILGNEVDKRKLEYMFKWGSTGMLANQFFLLGIDGVFERFTRNPVLASIINLTRIPLQAHLYSSVSYRVFTTMFYNRELTFAESVLKAVEISKDHNHSTQNQMKEAILESPKWKDIYKKMQLNHHELKVLYHFYSSEI